MTSEPSTEPAGVIPAAEAASVQAPASRWGGVVGLLAGVAIAATGAATFPLWRDQAGFPTPQAGFGIETLRAELSATTARLAQLEARPAGPITEAASPDPALAGRVAGLEHGLKALQAQPLVPASLITDVDVLSKQVIELRKTAADSATVLRLADRIDQAEAAIRDLQARRSSAAALLLAVGQLREAINQGLAFDAELRSVKALAGDDAEVARAVEALKDRATTGIKGRLTVAGRFEPLAPALVRAEILPEGEGWWRRALDRVLSLVTIRREDGGVVGNDTAAVVARAQAALNQGDLGGAVGELDSLSGAPAEAATPWLTEAKARLAADKALADLTAHVVALAGAKP